jgi:hypothetical protein
MVAWLSALGRANTLISDQESTAARAIEPDPGPCNQRALTQLYSKDWAMARKTGNTLATQGI